MTGGKKIMKTYSYSCHNALILIAACVFLSGYAASEAMSSDAQSGRAATLVQPVNGAARLVIRRIPDLGKVVTINLSIDSVPVATIPYGHTYEGFLSPGRHVLSVFPTPKPKYPSPWQMTLDVRSGHTYTFTAMGDSGHLILQAPGGPERPHSR
jgi:hypothetical protein